MARLTIPSAWSIGPCRRVAASVGVITLAVRTNSGSSNSSRKRRSAWLTAGWVSSRRAPAAVRLRCSQIAKNTRSRLRSSLDAFASFMSRMKYMNWTHGNGFVTLSYLSWSRRMTVLNRLVPSGLPTAEASPMGKAAPGKVTLETVIAEVTRRRDEFQRLRYVPRDMISIMKKAGIFRASTPKCFGGDALPPADFLRILERVAVADGSAAWVAAFGSANIYYAALPRQTQAEIYAGGPDQLFAGGLYPMHMARTVPGGYVATGRWRFASGCMGADWLSVGIGVEQPPDDAGNKRPARL